MVERRQEGIQGRKHRVVISKFYVQEKKLIIAGHAGQSGEEEKDKKKMQTPSKTGSCQLAFNMRFKNFNLILTK